MTAKREIWLMAPGAPAAPGPEKRCTACKNMHKNTFWPKKKWGRRCFGVILGDFE